MERISNQLFDTHPSLGIASGRLVAPVRLLDVFTEGELDHLRCILDLHLL